MNASEFILGAAVLEAIDTWWLEHCYPPSRRDLAPGLGVACSTVHYWCEKLADEGVIEMRDGHPVPKWVVTRVTATGRLGWTHR